MPFSAWSGSELFVYESDFWTKLGYFGHSECCAYSHKLFQRWRRKVCLCPLYNYVSRFFFFCTDVFITFHYGNLFVPNFCLFVWFLFHSLPLLISEKLSKYFFFVQLKELIFNYSKTKNWNILYFYIAERSIAHLPFEFT